MVDSTLYTYVTTAILAVLFYKWRFSGYYDIPTIGPSLPIVSYLGAWRFLTNNKELISEGYQKFKRGVFKVATFSRWIVVINGPELVEEVRKLPDDQASLVRGVEELMQLHYTFGYDVLFDPVHLEVTRDAITRHIAAFFGDLREETVLSFNDLIPAVSDKWTAVDTLPTMAAIVARISSRIFVGEPLCRNETYLDLATNVTFALVKTRDILTWFPEILRPTIASFVSEGKRANDKAKTFLGPLIQQRLDDLERFGEDWTDKPDDTLQWTIDLTLKKGKGLDEVVRYIMLLNFAAIHTSSNTFTQALYNLAAHPEYMQPLREEVEQVIEEEGWTKAAMQRLRKVDSFLREALRLNGIDGLSLIRKALKDVVLSNGTVIPAGALFVAASASTHTDSDHYDDPTKFNPWRFSDMREKEGESTRHQYVTTSVDYMPFGHGKHACPGRFFAANELKCMLAHIVLNYDVKLEDESSSLDNIWFASTIIPNPTIKVLFRKRQN